MVVWWRLGRGAGPGVQGSGVRTAVAAALLLAGSVSVAGCGGGADPAASTGPATETASFDPLVEPTRVPAIARAKLGEGPRVRHISLSHDGFRLEVRDPAKPDNLDDYYYRDGEWTTRPVSVSVREIQELDETTFGLGAVKWEAVPSLMQQALDGLDLEGEEIDGVSYDRIAGRPPRVYIGVHGLRGSGRLIANADGTDVEIARN